MFGIQLDATKKLELGFCVVVLTVAAWLLFFASAKPRPNVEVNVWTLNYSIGEDGKRATRDNPEKPERSYKITTVAGVDGKLEVKEFPNAPGGPKVGLRFIHTKPNLLSNQNFPSPRLQALTEQDELHRVLLLAVVEKDELRRSEDSQKDQNPGLPVTSPPLVRGRGRSTAAYSLFEKLGLKSDQRTAIEGYFLEMKNALALMETNMAEGRIEPPNYQKMLSALEVLHTHDGEDISKVPAKEDAAQKFMAAAAPLVKTMQGKRFELYRVFVEKVISQLYDENKSVAIEEGETLQQALANER